MKREAPICTTWTLRIKDDWIPTPSNINALPEPLRAYIHDHKTVCDSAGDATELFRLQTENRMLRWECERLAAKVGDVDAWEVSCWPAYGPHQHAREWSPLDCGLLPRLRSPSRRGCGPISGTLAGQII